MSVEDIVDGLAIIQQKRGRMVDQGDVEMLALAIQELRKGRRGSADVSRHDNTELAFIRCTAPGVYYDSKNCGYPNCKCERVYKQRDNSTRQSDTPRQSDAD